jgi:hypothetical protein
MEEGVPVSQVENANAKHIEKYSENFIDWNRDKRPRTPSIRSATVHGDARSF